MATEPLPRLPQRRSRRSSESNAATYAALIGLCFLTFGFLALVSLALPLVRGLITVLLAAVAFFAFHYLVWGRLLMKLNERDAANDDDE